jgi:Tfp pilus assembly protein PilP
MDKQVIKSRYFNLLIIAVVVSLVGCQQGKDDLTSYVENVKA